MDKRRRPKFGNRYLTNGEDVFKHNAWDDVEWNEEQEEEAKEVVAKNSGQEARLSPEAIEDLTVGASDNWDKFYGVHTNRFFKDRTWLFTEFPDLKGGPLRILEVGCGVGNTIYPVLETNNHPDTVVYGCDFSQTAVDLVREHQGYESGRCSAFVCDITDPEDWANGPVEESSLDAVTMFFVLSAIDPKAGMDKAIKNVARYLRPGGSLYFRDYGRYDLAQLRIKPGKCLDDNFYSRGDGTLCYFFTEQELKQLFEKNGFIQESIKVDRRLIVNRGKKLKMYRVWMQAKYTKKTSYLD